MTDSHDPEENPFEDHHDAEEKVGEKLYIGTESEVADMVKIIEDENYARGQKEGYDRGYAQGREDLLTGEPDGWCAWHPSQGWLRGSLAYDMAESKEILDCELGRPAWKEWVDGWEIVPVKLTRIEPRPPANTARRS